MQRPRSFATLSLASALLAVAAATGCQSQPKTKPLPPAVPITAQELQEIRSEFAQSDPAARVGQVTEVLADEDFLRFTDVDAADFPVGAVVTVIDNRREAIANGTVVKIVGNAVDVRFTPISGKRRPAAGDAVVKFGNDAAPAASR